MRLITTIVIDFIDSMLSFSFNKLINIHERLNLTASDLANTSTHILAAIVCHYTHCVGFL